MPVRDTPGGEKVEEIISTLESGEHSLCFSDGMRAIASAIETLAGPDSVILAHRTVYGGTIRYLEWMKSRWNMDVRFADLTQENTAQIITEGKPSIVFIESVTNPLLEVPDLLVLMNAARESGSWVLVDNTLATGYCCLPLALARSCGLSKAASLLSLTKGYTAGELGGAVVTDSAEFADALFRFRQAHGGNASPSDVERFYNGLTTMGIRMERLSESAEALAKQFAAQAIEGIRVLHPALFEGREREIAEAILMRWPGLVSLECTLSLANYRSLVWALEGCFLRSNSFNGVYQQLSESAVQSHAALGCDQRKGEAGISAQLVRLSPGTMLSPDEIWAQVADSLEDWQRQRQ